MGSVVFNGTVTPEDIDSFGCRSHRREGGRDVSQSVETNSSTSKKKYILAHGLRALVAVLEELDLVSSIHMAHNYL